MRERSGATITTVSKHAWGAEANARLIAAAPSMLATLEAVYARFRTDNSLASAEWCKHEIAAAIRKATSADA